jgi:hypothetical protein
MADFKFLEIVDVGHHLARLTIPSRSGCLCHLVAGKNTTVFADTRAP